jgi:hypothetical protein
VFLRVNYLSLELFIFGLLNEIKLCEALFYPPFDALCGNSASYILSRVFSLFTNKSSRLHLSLSVKSVIFILFLANDANLSKLSSNSRASSEFFSIYWNFFLL